MRSIRTIGVLITLFAVCSCSDSDGLLSPSERHTLASAQARWDARAFPDYSFEIEKLCFCPVELNAWTRVTVRGGAVVAAEPVAPDPGAPPLNPAHWEPIDSLFARILQSAQSDGGVYRDIVVAFDAALGFPTSIEWKEKAGVADAGAIYHVRNVQPAN